MSGTVEVVDLDVSLDTDGAAFAKSGGKSGERRRERRKREKHEKQINRRDRAKEAEEETALAM